MVVMLALRIVGRERLAPLAALLAVAAGIYAGNYFMDPKPMPWQLEKNRPLTVTDLRTVLGWSLEAKPAAEATDTSADPPPKPRPIYWLPWLAALAMLVELFAGLPKVPGGITGAARALTAMLAGRVLTPSVSPEDFRTAMPEVSWLLGLAILLEWSVLIVLARKWKDGTPAAAVALCLAAASLMLVLAGIKSYMDLALLGSAALVGPALVAWKWPSDTRPALAAGAVFLPGLVLIGLHDTSTEVPLRSFLLLGLAPLALAPLALPMLARQPGWNTWLAGLILPLIPAVIALILAAQVETLAEY
jgi:hypothetical protein